MKPRAQREQWILEYLWAKSLHGRITRDFIDVLNAAFVDAYSEECKVEQRLSFVGAGWCSTLGGDLLRLYRDGLLERYRTGIEGTGRGFPKWVYVYYLPDFGPHLPRDRRVSAQQELHLAV